MTDLTAEIPPELFARLAHPTVRLSGTIDEAAAASFLSQVLPVLEVPGSIVVELFSSGGDAEMGRRLAQEVRLLRQAHGRDMWFLGKTLVASAAVTIMASFPRDRRWLTRDTTLLIHGRRMMRNVHLEGPLGSCRRVLEEIIADIDNGLRVEDEGFAELIAGSGVSLDDIRRAAGTFRRRRRSNSGSSPGWFEPDRPCSSLGGQPLDGIPPDRLDAWHR